jgi:hypothetical protein
MVAVLPVTSMITSWVVAPVARRMRPHHRGDRLTDWTGVLERADRRRQSHLVGDVFELAHEDESAAVGEQDDEQYRDQR